MMAMMKMKKLDIAEREARLRRSVTPSPTTAQLVAPPHGAVRRRALGSPEAIDAVFAEDRAVHHDGADPAAASSDQAIGAGRQVAHAAERAQPTASGIEDGDVGGEHRPRGGRGRRCRTPRRAAR